MVQKIFLSHIDSACPRFYRGGKGRKCLGFHIESFCYSFMLFVILLTNFFTHFGIHIKPTATCNIKNQFWQEFYF